MRAPHALLPEGGFDIDRLLAPEQAVAAFMAVLDPQPPAREAVALDDAWGRVLAREIVADADYPSHERSTMDGFAVRCADTPGRLAIAGEVRMGHAPLGGLEAGTAWRIPTGGALPAGADAVVPIEDVCETTGSIDCGLTAVHANLTLRGDDMRAGVSIIEAARRIGAPELGVLATLGVHTVDVFARPRIAIVSTGDELVAPHAPLAIGQVRDSNRYAIAGSLRALGATPVHFPKAPDEPQALRAIVAAALEQCDAVVLTGGSSVGLRDFVPRMIAALGKPGVIVHGLKVKPGKPTVLGAVGAKPVIGLPGNPTSSLMILEAVVRPIVTALTGARIDRAAAVEAIAEAAFPGRAGWTWFVPATLRYEGSNTYARPLVLRSSHTSLLARAAGFVVVGETPPGVQAGERVSVRLFSSGGR